MKRIIVVCDYTGEVGSRSEDSFPTNASRFTSAISQSSDIGQIVIYNRGVDTDIRKGTGSTTGKWRKSVEGASGKEWADQVATGYYDIMNNYNAGDEIFLFGISRSAFTARVIANIVVRLGVIVKSDSWAFASAMEAHKDGSLDEYAAQCRAPSEGLGDTPRVHKAEVEVVGCWDTVASTGSLWNSWANPGKLSKKYRFLDGGLVQGIKHAFHALALDEYSASSTPTLWHSPPDSEDTDTDIDLRQCWFPGVHNNVVGACPDRALANLTLAWMIDQCHGLLAFDEEFLDKIVRLDRDPSQTQNNRSYRKKSINETQYDSEYQGWARGMWYDSSKGSQTWTRKYRTPGAYLEEGTRETMHSSVRERWQSSRMPDQGLSTGPPVWDPTALKGFELREVAGKWEWVKRDVSGRETVVIPEFSFPTNDSSFEYRLRNNIISSSS